MPHLHEIDDALKTVAIHDGFWGKLLRRNHAATLPHVWQQCENQGHMQNLDIAAGRSNAAYQGGSDRDSDLHKVMEGLAYDYAIFPEPKSDAKMDRVIAQFDAAQEPDGYLVTRFTAELPEQRYRDLHRSHELYVMGHLIEAAVEHAGSTGKPHYLDLAIRAADHLDQTFGPGRLETTSGHQQIELALIKLYRHTREPRYLHLARYFVDMRGQPDRVQREYGGKPIDEGDRRPGRNRPPFYRQDHLPAVKQREATGHAVRAGYLYAAMADLAMEHHDPAYAVASRAIWDNIVSQKLYITGGVGTHQYHDEGYGDAYRLPNDTGYCETCGGIALLLFSHRMNRLTGEARYADIVELSLLNNILACPDLDGVNFFYRNPLMSDGTRIRRPWCNPACCPTNIVRIFPQISRLAYATDDHGVYINQFLNSTATLKLGYLDVLIKQETNYPWDGHVAINVSPSEPISFAMYLRIPAWAKGDPVPSDLYTTSGPMPPAITLHVNNVPVEILNLDKGYLVIERLWQPGDRLDLELPMPVQRVHAHTNVEACRGQIALMRGPLVYAFEQTDHTVDLDELTLDCTTTLRAEARPDLLGGVMVIRDEAQTCLAVPYYAWNNREPGKMRVWVNAS